MNTYNVSQRASARMHFKSWLLLTLLAGSASAQQAAVPSISWDASPAMPSLEPAVPAFDAAMPPALDGLRMPPAAQLYAQPSAPLCVANSEAENLASSSRSTWTLRQHATWILGLKPRQAYSNANPINTSSLSVASDSIEPSLPMVPQVEIIASSANMAQIFEVPPEAIQLVQYNEPASEPRSAGEANAVTQAVHAQGDESQVLQHAHQTAPRSLNLGPVVAGPAPALPLDKIDSGSLLQVDLDGIDVAKLGSAPAPAKPESLIDSLELKPRVGFSMRDDDSASVAASPSRAKPVSIHEGFAPRTSSANQAAQLNGQSKEKAPASFSMSDKSDAPSGNSAPSSGAVVSKMSDKGSQLDSKPAEVSPESGRTSRGPSLIANLAQKGATNSSGKPVELTPPDRLAKDAPLALPLSAGLPIASTGIENSTVAKKLDTSSGDVVSKPLPSSDKGESLIDGLIPTLLVATESKPSGNETAATKPGVGEKNKNESSAVTPPVLPFTIKPAPQLSDMSQKPKKEAAGSVPPGSTKPVAQKPTESLAEASSKKNSEKFSLSDSNPIAMKRPVTKAATVSLPKENHSEVVQSSHEVDEADPQTAEYAKLATKMQQAVKQKFPNLKVKITYNEDGLIIEGNVDTNVEASKVLSFVRKSSLCPVVDRVTTSQ